MDLAGPPLSPVDTWRLKACEVSIQSDDAFVPLISRSFDVVSAILKDSEHRHIQRALESLDNEQSIYLRYEQPTDLSTRHLMYGLIESLHPTLSFLTEKIRNLENDCQNARIDAQNAESRAEEAENRLDSKNGLIGGEGKSKELKQNAWFRGALQSLRRQVISRLDEMTSQLAETNDELAQMRKKHQNEPLHKENSGGVAQYSPSIPDSIDAMSMIPKFAQFPIAPKEVKMEWNKEPIEVKVELKEEPIGDIKQIPVESQMPSLDFIDDEMNFNGEDVPNGDVDSRMDTTADMARMEDEISTKEKRKLQPPQRLGMTGFLLNEDAVALGISRTEAGRLKQMKILPFSLPLEGFEPDSSQVAKVQNKRRFPRSASCITRYQEDTESNEESDGDYEPVEKKRKSEKNSGNTGHKVYKHSEKELECHECEYRSVSVRSWLHHLRLKHSTNPYLAGLILRCECGYECVSEKHCWKCDTPNFIVIRKRDGPIRRFEDEKETPQCSMCEKYPSTAYGYVRHLVQLHNTSLIQNGIYLMCACGFKTTKSSYAPHLNHIKECDGRNFSIHKLAED